MKQIAKEIAAITSAAVLSASATTAGAQASAYDAEALSDRAAEAYDAGDSVLAAVLWRLSGKAGSADAMTAYGGLREIGDGVAPDPEDALRWYARAARRGDAHAMALLADALADTDPRRARALFAQASEQGHAYAARRLTHRLAFPPGETKVTAKGGFGENQ